MKFWVFDDVGTWEFVGQKVGLKSFDPHDNKPFFFATSRFS